MPTARSLDQLSQSIDGTRVVAYQLLRVSAGPPVDGHQHDLPQHVAPRAVTGGTSCLDAHRGMQQGAAKYVTVSPPSFSDSHALNWHGTHIELAGVVWLVRLRPLTVCSVGCRYSHKVACLRTSNHLPSSSLLTVPVRTCPLAPVEV